MPSPGEADCIRLGSKTKFGDVGLTQMTPFGAFYLFFNSSELNIIFIYKNEVQIRLILTRSKYS